MISRALRGKCPLLYYSQGKSATRKSPRGRCRRGAQFGLRAAAPLGAPFPRALLLVGAPFPLLRR